MSSVLCDRSAFAIIVVPSADGPTNLCLYHWRHVPGARKPTEAQLLDTQQIKSFETISTEPDSNWANVQLAPALELLSTIVPKAITVAVCVPESIQVDTRGLRDAIEKYCPMTSTTRDVTFQFERSTAPLDKCLEWSGSQEKFVAVYTLKPDNCLTIYELSGSSFTRRDPVLIRDEIDITKDEERLALDVNRWVTDCLHPALKFTGHSSTALIELFLPTEDLRANRFNTYNSVRDQITERLLAIPNLNITLAGSSDVELPITILDRLFEEPKQVYQITTNFMITIEHDLDTATTIVHSWNGKEVVEIFTNTVNLRNGTIPVPETEIIRWMQETIDCLDAYGGKNNIRRDVLFIAQGPLEQHWKTGSDTYRANYNLLCAGLNVLPFIERFVKWVWKGVKYVVKTLVALVFQPVIKHIVVVDAGSTGTRALLYRWSTVNPDVEPAVALGQNGPFPHGWLPWMIYVGESEINGGIQGRTADNIAIYLDPLFTRMADLMGPENVNRATTPLIGLATGGMRGRLEAAQQPGAPAELLNTYTALVTAIRNYFLLQDFQPDHRTFDVATGQQEAIYGWITANYSMGRLEDPNPTYGFLEMGGQSLQIAYQVPDNYNDPHTAVTITYGTGNLVCRVFTRMISGLGTKDARANYLTGQRQLGGGFLHDRCSIQGQMLDAPDQAVPGSGLCAPPDTLFANNRPLAQQIERLVQSFPPVRNLLTAAVAPPGIADGQPILLHGAPPIPVVAAPILGQAPAAIHRFVGGSSFWHANRSLYPHNIEAGHSFDFDELNSLICRFARENWAAHHARIVAQAAAIVTGMTDDAVRRKVNTGNIVNDRNTRRDQLSAMLQRFRRDALFCAMLVHNTLYEGIRLQHNAQFQPFDGVVGLYNGDAPRKVPYSWTLGRALIEATGSPQPPHVVPVVA